MTVNELYEKLTERWPKSLSAPWDNDGIMVTPDGNAPVRRILIALDGDVKAIDAAVKGGYDLLVTHHPAIFTGVKAVTPDSVNGRRILAAVRNGLSVISLHTRLDAGEGGVNDTLCRTLGFEPSGCFGDDEMPTIGRYADVEPMSGEALARLVKERLGAPAVRVTGDTAKTVRRIGFCGGDGKDLIPCAIRMGCDAYITGDAGYNMAEDAAEEGLFTVEAGHFHSENPVCRVLAETIQKICKIDADCFDSCAYRVI